MLRKPADDALASAGGTVRQLADPWEHSSKWESQAPLRWRLAMTTGVVVTIVVAIITLCTYGMVSAVLTASIDNQLEDEATSLLQAAVAKDDNVDWVKFIDEYRSFHPGTRASVAPPNWAFSYGDSIPVGGRFKTSAASVETSIRTIGEERVIAKRHSSGATVVLARAMSQTQSMVTTSGSALVALGALGVLMAILAGMMVSKAGLRPITRLQRAADYVTQTNDLRPIMVIGTDEMAQLTISFNEMLAALEESRIRQSQFVADAGHELKTPLTSMRTNIELLMMANRMGNGGALSEQDRQELEDDVLAQMSELSTLIGDLVDLAREDASVKATEDVELHEIVDSSLSRARRRRPDVDFRVKFMPWTIQGDQFSLGRAIVNLLDNAAKWSPASGLVKVSMDQVGPESLRLRVDDSGPGIPEEDRDKVFERFYRSAEARAMPGSGLGLAIVKQVVERHGGTIKVLSAPGGGARLEVILPGHPVADLREIDPGYVKDTSVESDGPGERKEIFAQRWFNQS